MQTISAKPQPRGRFATPRWFCFICVTFFGVNALACSSPGYLPCVGPAPLRFCSVPHPFTNIFVLPVPAATVPSPTNEPPVPPQLEKTNAVSAPPIPDPQAATNQIPNVIIPDSTVPAGVISPQMFLKYFSKSTNGSANTTVITPLDFTPPRTAPAPSSKATYSTTP